jgi:hypothetical protein
MKDEAFLSEQFRNRCTQEINEHCAGKKTKYVQCESRDNDKMICRI